MRRVFVVAVLSACANDQLATVPEAPPQDPTDVPTTCRTGGVTGNVCAANGTPLGGATVYVEATDCNGMTNRYEATTNDSGAYAIANIPVGVHDLVIDHTAVSHVIPVSIDAGEIVTVTRDAGGELLCSAQPPPHVAVITGDWDEVQVLLDGLDIPYDLIDGNTAADGFLSNFAQMSEYDAIFFNCGTNTRPFLHSSMDIDWGTFMPTTTFDYNAAPYQNLRQFVQNGGSVYASDCAWPVIEGLSSGVIDFWGDETAAENTNKGRDGTMTATITDAGLESFLGADTADIDFDLDVWSVIETVSSSVDVYVEGNVSVYTDDYNTQTGSAGVRPLLVGSRPFSGGGYVIYTTFHYHSQPSQEMLDILRYLIFQL